MAAANRDVTLTLAAQTSGLDQLRALAEEVRKLAKEGGDTAPEFKRIGDELDNIAAQQGAIDTFRRLDQEVGETKAALDAATNAMRTEQGALDALSSDLAQATAAYNTFGERVKEQRTALDSARAGMAAQRAEIDRLKVEVSKAGTATEEHRKALTSAQTAYREYKARASEARAEIARLGPELRALKTAHDSAEASTKAQTRALSNSRDTVEEVRAKHTALTNQLTAAGDRMRQAGVDATKLAAEENRLIATTARLTSESAQLKTQLESTAKAAERSGSSLDRAFSVVGLRSANEIRAEIQRVNSALLTLSQSSSVSGAQFDRAFANGQAKIRELERELRGVEQTTTRVGAAATGAGNALRNMAASLLGAIGLDQFIRANVALDSLERGLRVVTGSASEAAKELEFVRSIAEKSGVDIRSAGEAYLSYAAAAKQAGISTEVTRASFAAVTRSMSILGKSSQETEFALRALEQMVSKGVVSMEEFRQQLSERMPGAFQGVAKELGLTTQELNELIGSGRLTAEQVIPALTLALEKLYGSDKKVESLSAQINRLKNSLTETLVAFGQSGGMEIFLKSIGYLLLGLGQITAAFTTVINQLIAFGKVLVSIPFKGFSVSAQKFKEDLAAIEDEARKATERGQKLIDAINGISTAANSGSSAVDEHAEALEKLGFTTDAAAAKEKGLIQLTVEMAQQVIHAQKAYNELHKSLEVNTTSAEKLYDARRKEVEGLKFVAQGLVDETEKRRLGVEVAERELEAANRVSEARRAQVAALQAELNAGKLLVEQGKLSEAAYKQIETELQKQITTRSADAEKADAQAAAVANHVAVLKGEQAAVADNSKRVSELADAYAKANDEVEKLTAQKLAGKDVDDQLLAAQTALTQAAILYKDSLKDVQEAIKAKLSVEQANLSLTERQIQYNIEFYRSKLEQAKAEKDYASVAEYSNRIKEYEIELAQLKAQALRLEAEAQLKLIEAKRKELEASGQLTEVKRAELDAQKAAADAKMVEADIADLLAQRLEDLQRRSEDAAASTDKLADSAARGAREFRDMADAVGDVGDTLGSIKGGAAGDTGGSGQTSGAGSGAVSIPWERVLAAYGYDLNPEEFRKFQEAIVLEYAKASEKYVGRQYYDGIFRDTERDAVEGAMRWVRREGYGVTANKGMSDEEALLTGRTANIADRGQAPTAGGGSYTVNVNLGGARTTINAASDADARRLVEVLQQFEQRAI